ncbi:MAG: GPI anchored serine-threonine rich family protein [Bacteroidetes bacterium]|nr:GPI anchored serine-threonine rich family protein [Bacteroidota bacterium]
MRRATLSIISKWGVLKVVFIIFLISNLSCRENDNSSGNTILVPPKVEPTFLKITSPQYAEIWNYYSIKEIKWITSNQSNSVAIDLYRKHTHKLSIASETEDDGSYLWEVPDHLPSSNLYRIKLTNIQNPIDTTFSPFFSIR